MQEEYDLLLKNKTQTLVKRPNGQRVLRDKQVYKIKRGANREITRYKARQVVRSFKQLEGINYNKTFVSVVKLISYKALFIIAIALDLEIKQIDVKIAFLYRDIKEVIYVEQLDSLSANSNKVYRLNKALYSLKQAPRVQYNTLATFLKLLRFKLLLVDTSVFTKGHTFIAIYVDDLLIIRLDKLAI